MKREPTPGRETIPTSVRISPVCKLLWDGLASKLGLSNTGVLETAIRRMAKEEGIEIEAVSDTTKAANGLSTSNE